MDGLDNPFPGSGSASDGSHDDFGLHDHGSAGDDDPFVAGAAYHAPDALGAHGDATADGPPPQAGDAGSAAHHSDFDDGVHDGNGEHDASSAAAGQHDLDDVESHSDHDEDDDDSQSHSGSASPSHHDDDPYGIHAHSPRPSSAALLSGGASSALFTPSHASASTAGASQFSPTGPATAAGGTEVRPVARPALRGILQFTGGKWVWSGKWGMTEDDFTRGAVSDFYYTLTRPAPMQTHLLGVVPELTAATPLAGVYSGYFIMSVPPTPVKVEERSVTLEFQRDAAQEAAQGLAPGAFPSSYRVVGRGSNRYGSFTVEGMLWTDTGALHITKAYIAKTAATPGSGGASAGGASSASKSRKSGRTPRPSVRTPTARTPGMPVATPLGAIDLGSHAPAGTPAMMLIAPPAMTGAQAALAQPSTPRSRSDRRRSMPSHLRESDADPMARASDTLKRCVNIVRNLLTHQYAYPFSAPVDPVKLNIPDYFDIVKQPMDLGTVLASLEAGKYRSHEEFARDVRLIWNNALTYNKPGQPVHTMAGTMSQAFEKKYEELVSRLQAREARASARKKAPTAKATPRPQGGHGPTTPGHNPAPITMPSLSGVGGGGGGSGSGTAALAATAAVAPAASSSGGGGGGGGGASDRASSANRKRGRATPRSGSAGAGGGGGAAALPAGAEGASADMLHMIRMQMEQMQQLLATMSAQQALQQQMAVQAAMQVPAPVPVAAPSGRAAAAASAVYEEEEEEQLTFEEKRQLGMDIDKLDEENMDRVVRIIQERAQINGDAEGEQIEVDMDALDTGTLRQLQRFVADALNPKKRKGGNTSSARKSNSRPKPKSRTQYASDSEDESQDAGLQAETFF